MSFNTPQPLLMLTSAQLDSLRRLQDPTFQSLYWRVLARAEQWRAAAAPGREQRIPLGIARHLVDRVYTLGLLYRWTGDPGWIDALWRDRQSTAEAADHDLAHRLTQAERAHAEAILLNWGDAALGRDRSESIRNWLANVYLPRVQRDYTAKARFLRANHNWNQVLNSTTLIAALAVQDSHPHFLAQLLPQIRLYVPHGLDPYAPDGAAPEGPDYWWYAITYTCYLFSAMHSVLGTDYDLSQYPGLDHTGWWPIHCTGPTGLFFNYADSGTYQRRQVLPCMLFLANQYQQPAFADDEHAVLRQSGQEPLGQHLMWYCPPAEQPSEPPRHHYFRGPVEVVTLRSSWIDPDAWFLAAKAGHNWINHGHQDLGGFELDALGVRWFLDLGRDSYDLPDYFGWREGEQRWRYLRCGAHGHNVPLLGDADQAVQDVNTRFIRFDAGDHRPMAIADLTDCYRRQAVSVQRGFRLLESQQALLLQDEICLREPLSVCSNLVTDATIVLESRQRARLMLQDRTLYAHLIQPSEAYWKVVSADPPPPETSNPGLQRLIAKCDASTSRTITIGIFFTTEPEVAEQALSPLAQWHSTKTADQQADCKRRSKSATGGGAE